MEELERRVQRLESELRQTQAKLKLRDRQLELLTLAARDLNSTMQGPELMRRLVWMALELVDAAEGVWGQVVDGRIVIVESLWRDEGTVEPRNVVFGPNVGVPGHVMVTGEPYISNDPAHDEHVLPELQKARGFYNLIDLPLFDRSGELVGCFELHDKKDHQPFTQEDLTLLDALRALAGVALENVRLQDEIDAERRSLKASETKFRRLFESNLIGIVFGDIHGGLYDVNDYYARLIGVSREDVLAGKVRWETITPPEDMEKDRAAAKEMLESPHGVCSPYEKRYILPDGRVVWILLGVAFIDEGRSKNVAFVLDITQSKESEEMFAGILNSEQLAREEAEATLSQLRLERELREQFVSALSHDLRTPLTAAKMSAQLIPRQPQLPDKVYSLAARVRQNIDRADQMISDLLDANRIRAGQGLPIERSPGELRQLVAGTLEELSTVHGDRFLLQGEESIEGDWDARALRRLLENLCGNAIKYGDPTRPVTVSLKQEGDEVALAVHNWGEPIPAEDQKSLFQYFSRTKSAQTSGKKGWGIGLTLVRGVAEAHGGSVGVESCREKGTVFRVRLPRTVKSLP
ncbi:ATP-binding protein [Archangium lansingense]|uniref:histidine kinase n=1 Tax=Archangium lansingense TaxID=2995310 RepID=A0ABT4ANE2_9BACT|nr:ATP-binding protein [Archangium lansinium]MCY1083096.1 ATP-binding protein [Archangium lansinium]